MIHDIACPHCECYFPIRFAEEDYDNGYKELFCLKCHKQISLAISKKFIIISPQPIAIPDKKFFDITCPECKEINPVQMNETELANKFKQISCRSCKISLRIITKAIYYNSPFVQVFATNLTNKNRQTKV